MKKILRAVALLFAAALSACAAVTEAPSGLYRVSPSYTVTLGRQWSDISAVMYQRPKNVRLLSIDGPLLNRLYLTDGLAPGDFLVKPEKKELPTPTYRAGMTPSELSEFVTDSVAALDYERTEVTDLKPAKFGAADAIHIDLKAVTKAGLDMSGTALVAESGGKLYVILYLAPTEHYYGATLEEVQGIMASGNLTGAQVATK
jgi:hypothetical protein